MKNGRARERESGNVFLKRQKRISWAQMTEFTLGKMVDRRGGKNRCGYNLEIDIIAVGHKNKSNHFYFLCVVPTVNVR